MAELEPGASNNMLVQYPTRPCRTLLDEGEVCFEKLANSAIILEFFRRRLKEINGRQVTLQDHADYDLIQPVNELGQQDYSNLDSCRIKLTLKSHLMIYYSDAVIMRLLQLGKPGTEFDLHKRATFAYRKHIGRLIGLRPAYDWNSLSKKELEFVGKHGDRSQFDLVWLWLQAREHHVAPMSVTTLHQLTSTEGLSDFYSTQTFWALHLPDTPQQGRAGVKVLRASACQQDPDIPCTPALESPGLVGLIAKEVLRETRITKYDGEFGSRPNTITFEEFCDRACIQEYGVLMHSSYLWGNSNRFVDYLYTICVGEQPGPDVKRYGKICRMVNRNSTYIAPEAWFPLTVDQVKAYLRYAVLLRESKYSNEQKAAIAQSIAITDLGQARNVNGVRRGAASVPEITMKVDLGKLHQYPIEFLTVFARCNGIYDFDRMRQHPDRLRKAIVAISDSTSAPLDVTINLSDAFKTHLALLISREGNDGGRFDGVDINLARNYAVVTLKRLDDNATADAIKHQLVYEVICAMRNPGKETHNANYVADVHMFTTQCYRGFLKYLQYQTNQKNHSRKRPRS